MDKEKLSLTLQFLEMARNAYNDKLITDVKPDKVFTSPGGWVLHQKHRVNKNGFDAFVFRKKYQQIPQKHQNMLIQLHLEAHRQKNLMIFYKIYIK
ncbi:hypothetical protein [Bacillus pretiosus]|uniref:hypothetical protein n=1 Tax=Bacillus pretiosus TaxID=2983392 RepID=UPI003D64612E